MKKKLLSTVLAGTLLLGGISVMAYGEKSQAYIGYDDRAVDGNSIRAEGKIEMHVQNASTSSHGLWAEVYQTQTGADKRISGVYAYKGNSETDVATVPDGTYYIHLDVDGPLYTGCKGYGYGWNK